MALSMIVGSALGNMFSKLVKKNVNPQTVVQAPTISSIIGEQKGINEQLEREKRELMEREDAAVVRRTQDVQNAGLHPMVAAGQAASTTAFNPALPDNVSLLSYENLLATLSTIAKLLPK